MNRHTHVCASTAGLGMSGLSMRCTNHASTQRQVWQPQNSDVCNGVNPAALQRSALLSIMSQGLININDDAPLALDQQAAEMLCPRASDTATSVTMAPQQLSSSAAMRCCAA